MNDDLRAIDWVPDGDIKLRPRTFVTADASRLTLSGDLFARKFDAEEDAVIFDLLEAHLKTPAGNVYVAEAPGAAQSRGTGSRLIQRGGCVSSRPPPLARGQG